MQRSLRLVKLYAKGLRGHLINQPAGGKYRIE